MFRLRYPLDFDTFVEPALGNFENFPEPLRIVKADFNLIGLLTVTFNKPVTAKLDEFSLLFNQLSSEERISFTYKIVEVLEAQIKIELVFNRPLLVCQGSQEDRAIIYIPILAESASKRLL